MSDRPEIFLPERIPLLGFYYHFKHDPKGEINNGVYEFVDLKYDSLDEEWKAVYRSLSADDKLYQLGHFEYTQPLKRFLGEVEVRVGKGKKTKMVPRFTKIEDRRIIGILQGLRSVMYEKRLPNFRLK